MEDRKFKVVLKGVAPLLLNKFISEEKQRKKEYVPADECKKKLYIAKDGTLYVPTTMVKAAMISAGSDFPFKGKKTYKQFIKSGIFFDSEEAKLTPQKYSIDERPVQIGDARVLGWRPRFEDWKIEFTMNVIDEFIGENMLKDILSASGKYKGIGSYRPEFGRFIVESIKKL
jgi:hypothetical protein